LAAFWRMERAESDFLLRRLNGSRVEFIGRHDA
jgi:hypothetical protein